MVHMGIILVRAGRVEFDCILGVRSAYFILGAGIQVTDMSIPNLNVKFQSVRVVALVRV